MTEAKNYFDAPIDDFEEPKILEPGEYIFTVTGYKMGRSTGPKQTQYVRLFLRPESDATDPDREIKKVRNVDHTYWLTDDAGYIFKQFARDRVGVVSETADGSRKTNREVAEEIVGAQVRAETKIDMVGKEKDIPKAVVDRFFALELV